MIYSFAAGIFHFLSIYYYRFRSELKWLDSFYFTKKNRKTELHECVESAINRNRYQYWIDDLLKNFFDVESIKSVGRADKLMWDTPSLALIISTGDFAVFIAQRCLSSRNTMMQAAVNIAIIASQNEIIKVRRTHFHHGSPW